jgi:hypothetical protein
MDGGDMLVRCANGKEGFDSLNGEGPAGGDDDGPTWEWWCASESPRTHWTRDANLMRAAGEIVKTEDAK